MRALLLTIFVASTGCSSLPQERPNIGGDPILEPIREGDLDSKPFSDEEKAQSHGKLGGVWVACYRAFQPQGDPAGDLAHLTAACGKTTGLVPITNVHVGETQSDKDAVERFAFRVRAGRCYRLFAVAESGVSDLDVAVVSAEGHLVAADISHDRWPVVPPRGPLCFEREGVYSIEAAVTQGNGSYVIQVWGDESK